MPKKVFISYSHDSDAHDARVRKLADSLRKFGVECIIDQYEQDWLQGDAALCMQGWIESCDFVLVVCTETYKRRIEKKEALRKGQGAKWEGLLIRNSIYDNDSANDKFVPVLFESKDKVHRPLPLIGANYHVVDDQAGFDRLYAYLTGQHPDPPPPVGDIVPLRQKPAGPTFGRPGANSAQEHPAPAKVAAHLCTDNLAEASAAKNNNFVGRVKQLDALAALVNRADGPSAVVIVAGAGFGKTELAKHFVNTRAHPAPVDANPSALRPDEWTARWWLDGSEGGEAASLHSHYAIITGTPFPDEPRPPPGDDPVMVAAGFRTRLRKDIAAACSAGRQLLVIDNAETPAQIAQYKPGNRGRLIATTRRQPIPRAVGHEFALDVLSETDARDLLAGARPDLRDAGTGKPHAKHAAALDAIAMHLGHHALALAYAAAALARPPYKSPAEVLKRIQAADIGDATEQEWGADEAYGDGVPKRPLAQSLGMLLDELADPASPAHDALALDLALLAAFCAPTAIPISLLIAASGKPEAEVEHSLRALHERSIITLSDAVGVHRLTQSLLRGRARRGGVGADAAALIQLLDALIELFRYPAGLEEQLLDHTKTPARLAALAHAEAAIAHAGTFLREAGEGAAAPLPRTPTPAMHAQAAHLRVEMAKWLPDIGQLADAARHSDAAITWGEAQSPRDERSLAVWYALRACIRQSRGMLKEAEDDIAKAIAWGEAQSQRDERGLAIDYASRASIRQDRGDLEGAEEDIAKAIAWFGSQSPRDERSLAIGYADRASIRQSRGLLKEAEEDNAKAITWGEAQSPRDERSLAIDYASRASIREDQAIAARRAGDVKGAAALFEKAKADIAAALTWFETNLPSDERTIRLMRRDQARIDEAAKGE